ncbi:MAG: Eco57I restriction-modification methylase domain-containing protein [Paracraurococcus sp.]
MKLFSECESRGFGFQRQTGAMHPKGALELRKLDHAESVRRDVSPTISQSRKSEFGQFMTPAPVARFMASLFSTDAGSECRLLDAGAGVGALSCAFLDRWVAGDIGFQTVEAFAYEIDDRLRDHLARHLSSYTGVVLHVIGNDFIEHATRGRLFSDSLPVVNGGAGFTHAILNPPYKKINNSSSHRTALRSVGIETVNLYSGFVALAVEMLAPGGEIVAIIPRSWCNGPYYRPFRDYIFARVALRHIHLFESRTTAFKDDGVLQENIIIHLQRGVSQGPVKITTSTDDTFSDIAEHEHPFERIVFPDDPERFVHVPTSSDWGAIELSTTIRSSLNDLGIKVSTGPVVDFRLRNHLRPMPEPGAIPLLYSMHFSPAGLVWPQPDMKKPNAIMRNSDTERWLFPNGFYCVVRRFSSKEERRRVVASVVDPSAFEGMAMLGFENHLNVFHEGRRGLTQSLAHGLCAYLNTTAVDESFRRFNGHTQVNATDLKLMKYPSRETLMALGGWVLSAGIISQDMLDEQLRKLG